MSIPHYDDIDMNSCRIRALPSPVNADEAVRKDYVDALLVEPGTVTTHSGAGATGNVQFGTTTINTGTDVQYWIVDVLFEVPGNPSQAGFIHLKGFVSRGTGVPIVGFVTQVAEAITGTPALSLVVTGSNVSVQLALGAATGISWKARIRRITWAQFAP